MKKRWSRIMVMLLLAVMLIGVHTVTAKAPPVVLKVEVFDRALPGYQPDNNYWTRWVQEKFGDPNNITVKFVPVVRAQEIDRLNVLMATNDAPDIVYTYDIFVTANYCRMGGVQDLTKPLAKYGKRLTQYIGPEVMNNGVFFGKQYTVPAKRALNAAINTFIRKDWLDKLGLPVPKTTQEWYNTMKAFKEKDPGKLGDQCIPFAMHTDNNQPWWESQPLLDSFKQKMTKLDADTKLEAAMPGFKEGLRFMNKMYNEGLISPEFALDRDFQKLQRDIQQGRVGCFTSNYEQPYRINPGLNTELAKNVPGAQFIPVDCFTNSEGKYVHRVYPQFGFFMMVPKSSKRVKEAIKYLDWMAQPEVKDFLLNGEKGVHYKEMRNGIPVNILVDGEKRLTSDMALIVNGKDYGSLEKNIIGSSFGYPGYEDQFVQAYKMAVSGETYVKPTWPTEVEAKFGKQILEKETEIFVKTITCKPSEFDQTYDGLIKEYNTSFQPVYDARVAYVKANTKKK